MKTIQVSFLGSINLRAIRLIVIENWERVLTNIPFEKRQERNAEINQVIEFVHDLKQFEPMLMPGKHDLTEPQVDTLAIMATSFTRIMLRDMKKGYTKVEKVALLAAAKTLDEIKTQLERQGIEICETDE